MAVENRGPQLVGVVIALYVTSMVTGALRFYTHGFILKRFFAEDYITIFALAVYTAYSAFAIIAVSHGLGKHVVDVSPEDRPLGIKYRWLGSIMYIIVSLLTKWIIGLFLLRICPRKRWRQITIWTILGVVTLFSLLYFAFDVRSCHPVQYAWTRYSANPPENGTCNASSFATVLTYMGAFLNIVADWVLPALPATVVWKAQIERRMKISIIALLCLGSTASIATIVRIPYADGILDNPDYLWTGTDISIWSTVEIGVALTASSLATLRPLMRKVRFFQSTSEALGYGYGRQSTVPNATAVSHVDTAGHVKSYSHGNNHIVITGSPPARETWMARWGSKGSMEMELVGKNPQNSGSISQVVEVDVERGDYYVGMEKSSSFGS